MKARTGALAALITALVAVTMPPAASADGIVITPPSLANAKSGNQYEAELHAQLDPGVTLNAPSLAWDITSGALPEGMYLSSYGAHAETGVITGIPYLPGTFDFTVTAHDFASQHWGSQAYTLTVALPTDPEGLANLAKFTPTYVLRHSGCVGYVATTLLSGRPLPPPGDPPCS